RGLALRDVVGGDDGEGGRDALPIDVGLERVADVRKEAPREEVDLVLLDELARLVQRRGRIALVVLDDQLDLPAAHLPSDLVQVELRSVHHVLAGRRERACQRREHSDLDWPALGTRGRGEQEWEGKRDERQAGG